MDTNIFLSLANSIVGIIEDEACLIDLDGKIIAFNEQFNTNYRGKYSKNAIIGDLAPKKLLDDLKAKDLFNHFLKKSASANIPLQEESINEEHTIYRPILISNQLLGIVCLFKAAHKKPIINRDEEKFYSLFEQASDSIMITDFLGNIIDANVSFCSQFGFSKDELQKINISTLLDKDELKERPLNFDVINDGRRVFSHRKMFHKNGEVIYVEANLKKFCKNQVLAIVKDITEIKNSQTQIEISEAQFKAAFDNTAIGIALVSLQGSWIKINMQFCKMLGYEEEELFKLTFKDFTHPDDFPNCIINIQKIILGEVDTWRTEKRYKHKNGNYLWINFNASIVKDSKNTPLFIVAQFENITERKSDDHQKEMMTKDLILQNKNFEQFTYIVSHNLRAPVANLIGLSGLLKDESFPIEIRNKCINELEISSQRLDGIIHDLNNILQIKREITEKKEEIYFATLIDHIQLSIQNIIVNEKVKIHTNFSNIEYIETLKSYIYSIFFNLITNSIKYRHPERTPVINISSEIVNNKVILNFKDNGMGMDIEKQGEYLFRLYKRFHLHTEGKGMGLFVVKTQVETLGGTITANGKINEGLAFRIELPLN